MKNKDEGTENIATNWSKEAHFEQNENVLFPIEVYRENG